MKRIEENGKVYGELDNGSKAIVASDRIEINIHRDSYGQQVGMDIVYRNKVYTGFGSSDLPLAVISAHDLPQEQVGAVAQALTATWLQEYCQNQIFEIPNNPVEVANEN